MSHRSGISEWRQAGPLIALIIGTSMFNRFISRCRPSQWMRSILSIVGRVGKDEVPGVARGPENSAPVPVNMTTRLSRSAPISWNSSGSSPCGRNPQRSDWPSVCRVTSRMPLRRSIRADWYLFRYSSNELIGLLPLSQSRRQDDLAADRAVAHLPQPIGKALERIGGHHKRREFAGFVESEQLLEALDHLVGRPLLVITDLQTADFDILHQQVVCSDLRDHLPAGEANHNHPATPGECTQCRLEHLAADRIEDDVGSLAAGCFAYLRPQAVAKIGAPKLDHRVRPGQVRQIDFFGGDDPGEHPGAECFGELDGSKADRPRSAEHEHSITWPKACAIM